MEAAPPFSTTYDRALDRFIRSTLQAAEAAARAEQIAAAEGPVATTVPNDGPPATRQGDTLAIPE